MYSSDSETDMGGSPDARDGKTRRDGQSSSAGSSKSTKNKGNKETSHTVTSRLPKPEEIAAAFKDTRGGVVGKSVFLPVPRIVQEKQRDGGKGSSSSSKHSENWHMCCEPYPTFVLYTRSMPGQCRYTLLLYTAHTCKVHVHV